MALDKQAIYTAQMPANVCLIGHLFASSSLAFSLPKLHTTVSLSTHRGTKDTWKITNTERLSYQSIDNYLKHLQRVKNHLGYNGGFFVQSNNSFPIGLGLSSSSSSYSALTACAVKAIQASGQPIKQMMTHDEISLLSAEGKHSSKHSFYSPWSIAENNSMAGASFAEFDQLTHVALKACDQQKRIGMEQILSLIEKNPRVEEYANQVRKRVFLAHDCLENKNWKGLFDCVWEDFIELHQLFHTCKPSFSFHSPATKALLQQVKHWWDIYDDGPLLTMGMGYVVHLLFRPDQQKMKRKMLDSMQYHTCIEGTESNRELMGAIA